MGHRVTVTKRIVRLDPDALAVLEEQRSFLRRSLADLEREHEAGDLETDDYEVLKHDYESRLASVSRAVDEGRAELATSRPPPRRGRTALTATAVVVFALVCGFVVARSAGRRDPGGSITGEITKTARERNTECLDKAQAKPADAVACYTGVLADSPNNVESLTYRGWIRFTSGDSQGLTDLHQAVQVDGAYPDVHAFLAVVLFRAGCVSDANNELVRLDALNPSPLILQLVADLRTQVKAAMAAPSTTANVCAGQ
jgi:cytochrome c-type biogenesis protein CcmH/NrfG